MIELTQEFGFDAAHYLNTGVPSNARMHGHSFYCEVTLRGDPEQSTGFLRDLNEVKAALEAIREELDHRVLNEVEGLGNPTLENLARYIWTHVEEVGSLVKVSVHRDSCGESCAYYGDLPTT